MFTFTNSWLLSWTKQGKFKGRSLEQLVGLWQLWCCLPRPTEQTSGLSLGFWAECPGLSGLFCCLQLQAMPCKDDGIMLQRIVWCGISVRRWGSKDLFSSLWRPRKTGHDICASPGCVTSGWVYFCWYRTSSHSLVSSLLCFLWDEVFAHYREQQGSRGRKRKDEPRTLTDQCFHSARFVQAWMRAADQGLPSAAAACCHLL